MRIAFTLAVLSAVSISACMPTQQAGLGASSTQSGSAPAQAAALPDLDAECTGPNAQNFNGARLSNAVIAQVPQQFEADRTAMGLALAGNADEKTKQFLRLCHGLTL